MDKKAEKILSLRQRLAQSQKIKDFKSFKITQEREVGDLVEVSFQWKEDGETKEGAGLFEKSELKIMKNKFE